MKLEIATFGAGCFWCIEAVIQRLKGVHEIVSGYSGGTVPGVPTYREVCSGLTGHAEVVQVSFDADIISYQDLIIIFMTSHNPTQLNMQGADRGTQYRSVIYYHSEEQKADANSVIIALKEYYSEPIVTEVSAAQEFHAATKDHQDYYNENKGNQYCSLVIDPKIAKLKAMYADKLMELKEV
jgi:peptide-methionine (S)-S-oxide reductase